MVDSDDKLFVISELYEFNPSIKVISFNRANKSNAYNSELLEAFYEELQKVNNDASIHAIVITGMGNSFCAGADLNELNGRRAEDGIFLKSREVFDYLAALSKITIASINGPAIGGGLELSLACDFRVCSLTASFCFPEVLNNLLPAAGGIRRAPALLGIGLAKEMIILGRKLNAEEAFKYGLVSYAGDQFMQIAFDYAQKVSALDQFTVMLAKKVINQQNSTNQGIEEPISQALLYERKFNSKN